MAAKPGNDPRIRDLTTGSVPGTMLRFAMPLFLSGLLQMVYNMVDMIVVGQMVGTAGLSAVSVGGEMMMLITFIAMGFSNAGQILISRYVGEKRPDRIGEMVSTLFTLLISLAVVIMFLFLLTYRDILAWLNTPESIWEYTRQYSITCILGIVFIYGYNLVSAILRGMGDSKHPFLFIAVASVINLVLDLLFVGPMGMGPLGAALATVIGQGVSFLFALVLLYRGREQIHFDFKPSHFRISRSVIRPLLSLGIPMVIQSAAITFSMLFVNSYINQYGKGLHRRHRHRPEAGKYDQHRRPGDFRRRRRHDLPGAGRRKNRARPEGRRSRALDCCHSLRHLCDHHASPA